MYIFICFVAIKSAAVSIIFKFSATNRSKSILTTALFSSKFFLQLIKNYQLEIPSAMLLNCTITKFFGANTFQPRLIFLSMLIVTFCFLYVLMFLIIYSVLWSQLLRHLMINIYYFYNFFIIIRVEDGSEIFQNFSIIKKNSHI